MDLSLEDDGAPLPRDPLYCFNPCFHGSLSGSFLVVLFLRLHFAFQSLFSWISLWKSVFTEQTPFTRKSFNPCFHGSLSGRRAGQTIGEAPWKFQSLFSWISLWKGLLPVRSQMIRTLFQSLFSWISLWKKPGYWRGRSGTLFQSLFSWISLWKAGSAEPHSEAQRCFNPCFHGSLSGSSPFLGIGSEGYVVSILVFM